MPGLAIGTSPAFGNAKPVVVHPLLNDLLAYWDMQETTGHRADRSGNGHTLTPAGSVTYDTGLHGNAALFHDNSLDQLLIDPCPASPERRRPPTAAFTVVLWFNVYSVPEITYNYRRLIDHADATVVPPGVWRLPRLQQRLSPPPDLGPSPRVATGRSNNPYASNGSNWYHGNPVTTTHAWHWLFSEYDPATGYFNFYYDNNFQTGSPPTPYACPQGIYQAAAAVPLTIGAPSLTNNNTMDGLIDEVAFWSRVLTATERAWLYNAGSGRSYAAIAAYTG